VAKAQLILEELLPTQSKWMLRLGWP